MKYIDSDKLIAEIEIIRQSLENRDVRSNQVKKIRTECSIEFCKCIIDVITSLQQEPPSLPSNLGEAAQRIAYDVCKQLPNGEEKDGIVYYAILAAIAGAEWMAGQISKAE